MKRSTLLLLFVFLIKSGFAQDTIMQTNGTPILGVVQEVGISDIKYRKYENRQTSPVYVLPKYLVSRINYGDGTSDFFTPAIVTPVVASSSSSVPLGPSSALYIGTGMTPFAHYQGGNVNTYWQNLFASEAGNGSGKLKLNTGTTQLFDFTFGMSVIGGKQNNWTFEMGFGTSPHNAVSNSASYADGTSGNLDLRFSSLNTSFQYTRGFDTTNRIQLGVEGSLDVGFMTGKENDVFYGPGGIASSEPITTTYEGVGLGGHFALVGKYYPTTSKNLGIVLKAGYRSMKIDAESASFMGGGLNGPVDWGGSFVSAGLILQLNLKPVPYSPYSYYGCGC